MNRSLALVQWTLPEQARVTYVQVKYKSLRTLNPLAQISLFIGSYHQPSRANHLFYPCAREIISNNLNVLVTRLAISSLNNLPPRNKSDLRFVTF